MKLMNISTVVLSSSTISTLLLLLPLLNPNSTSFNSNTKLAIKMAFFVSSIPVIFMLNENILSLTISWKWLNVLSSPISLTIWLDHYTILFTPITLLITWSIVEYSTWYMQKDMKINLFFKYLLIFLLMMVVLISAGDLFTLFIGWEGVGIMSYLLIGWYFARSNAGTAALQAVLYNRIGDIGFLFTLFWLMSSYNTLDLKFLFYMDTPTPVLFALILAAASKSAQFGLHPWLSSAMEGPTPVSALLHSSTMVVAGVFLMIRIHPMIKDNHYALSTCLSLGAISTLFAAMCALTQNDIKKIIAFSTSSQLGLMIVAIGLNMPHLAFFHICTHAFFKAMLFLCSGSIIHNLDNEQDIRKMGGLQKILPITISCTSIGSLSLMGTPYLAGFFSKDAIIEAMSSSNVNTWAMMITIMATSFTAVYNLRIIFFASAQHPRSNSILSPNETDPAMTNPLKRLTIGSVITGLLLNQIILPSSPMTSTLPTNLKTLAITASLMGFFIAIDLASLSWTTPPSLNTPPKTIYTSFLPTITHRLIPTNVLNFSLTISSHLIDSLWLEKLGPSGMTKLQLPMIMKNQEAQQGVIKIYLSVFTFSLLLCLVLSQLV